MQNRNPQPRHFIVDLDETILAYCDEFQFWMERKGYRSRHRLRNKYDTWPVFGLGREESLRFFREFQETAAFSKLRVEPDARIVLTDLHQHGFTFEAVTAVDPHVAKRREENILAELGFHIPVRCVGLFGSKRDVLAACPPAYFIDDVLRYALDGLAAGHCTFLIDREHNRTEEPGSYHRVADWFVVREMIGSGLRPGVDAAFESAS